MAVRLDLDIKYQKCRGPYRHAFDDYVPGVGEKVSVPWGQRLYLRCVRCGMKRHDTFDLLGNLSTRRYIPPPGYKLAKDEVPTLAQLRRSVAAYVHDQEVDGNGHKKRAVRVGKKAPAKRRRVAAR